MTFLLAPLKNNVFITYVFKIVNSMIDTQLSLGFELSQIRYLYGTTARFTKVTTMSAFPKLLNIK